MTKEQQDNYFTNNWTIENLKLLADFNNWQTNANINTNTNNIEQLKDEIRNNGNVGDTELRKIHENSSSFTYLSLDSGIEVINVIFKDDFPKSESIELF